MGREQASEGVSMNRQAQKQHILALIEEVRQLEERMQPTDTGHIATAINVLMGRIDELLTKLVEEK
jgi:hypothetical protein